MGGNSPITTLSLKEMKRNGQRIVMLTAYDYPSAKLADEAGVDMILVGDSLGMVVLGYDSTLPVTLDDMIHHTKAVTRGVKRAFVVTDMPFLTYHGTIEEALRNAGRIMQEGLAKAIKIEGGAELAPLIRRCTQAGIPVVGHIGLTPQSVHQLGGYKVQGKTPEAAQKLMDDALALEEAGVFALVMECVPKQLAEFISRKLSIPTIGIGAGAGCDGQVLVYHDILSYGSDRVPKFVKKYADAGSLIKQAISRYAEEVRSGAFPEDTHTFAISEEALEQLYGGVKA
ncbi:MULTISPECIES: 3-methyl-2-oxobutanoate hydroxymethyltransferase [Aneurinibacillus]|uniref:3-methyl-2-oxobutanoate hydroxymethyltransferase n=1 Tax=Aneurinibacillus thermoaerophilus TaxID=143495 RepID=A0A1G8BTR3_ANETH|nr:MULTISPECIES: 3-methyl-2-oxobutanoate hydroxymethyltransferase [Aneurinibacillus]AMA73541.1 3-methyl-2-oxobutanoate hydroxymethyltransferase [Aneurinibacillus sp. XH2]MED0674928.1 3-methyl-2-oxobutanoate hydroxymethyltransferase [Aneurinibacillus thermoaerophilus]MED0679671.1 3-methyl-2-oxobutanoate hydroxymethyltransferase [Aneurinibacillus thermoaerophilus]MED0737332.1 3-methyl-2-oxobutanoate hydroxymethyltransferase [Aneurinibacillus thermoaerophilus]MED0756180.1 3-methyl-2-oxobutanoate 